MQVAEQGSGSSPAAGLGSLTLEGGALAQRLLERRRRAGLSQAELARRAGVRVETLNRIERGKVTPDFATIRKLVVALHQSAQAPHRPPTGAKA
jgi:DNA-binding XRE family transcriptional regulator